MGRKEAYRQLAEAQLEEQKAHLNLLKARAKKLIAKGKLESYRQLDELEDQIGALKESLSGLAEAGDDAWEELKNGFERVRDDVSRSVQKFLKDLD